MKTVNEAVHNILIELKSTLTDYSFETEQRSYIQLLKMAHDMKITIPNQKLFDAFALDDHGLISRRKRHAMVLKRVDLETGLHAIRPDFRPYNPIPLPSAEKTENYLSFLSFPITESIDIGYIIVRSLNDLRSMQHQAKSIDDDYLDSMRSIHCFLANRGGTDFDSQHLDIFMRQRTCLKDSGTINKNRWYCDQKAVAILKEVAMTGHYKWKYHRHAAVIGINEVFAPIQKQYIKNLKTNNLSNDTIKNLSQAYTYVVSYSGVDSLQSLSELSSKDVQKITTRLSETHDVRSLRSVYSRVRLVLRYLYEEGFTNQDCSCCMMLPISVRENVAGYFSEKDENIMCEHLSELSLRDKAICLLAMELGLRDYDISHLRFEQIDWSSEQICIVQHKNDEPMILPLLTDIGNALMEYILLERPETEGKTPFVFLTSVAPFRRLKHAYKSCRKLIDISGAVPIQGKHKGSHLYRDSLVHRMLEKGVKHQIITNALGHQSREADKYYITMEPEMLRQCSISLDLIGFRHWKEGEHYA